ncbi:MAG: hypothetical protein A2270_01875 [Elusimicrobia bacterium RIFOXYA12_FULL_51_18]|nr:MAG: hypothetical protein A2270_01875 [Elusimicrobia bacterium RIFOXYA12_FULL_51_18]OGS32487.1 MAG: hypothetical protein A2218_03645 [Elusimicrobia bacterium RIFOXYA2_FULL_53_38]
MFDLNFLNFSLLAFLGFFIGILGSVLGVGGGVFIVPLLVLALGVPIHQAIAVSLVAIVATSSAVASVNVERGLANMRLGVALEVPTALGSIIGALAASRLSSNLIYLLFSIMLAAVSISMFLKGRRSLRRAASVHFQAAAGGAGGALDSSFFDPSTGSYTSYRVKNMAPASFVSFFAGGLSGLLGIGGGVIQVPVMNLLCGVPFKAAAATSNFLIGVSAAASVFIYLRKGYLIPDLAAVIVIGVLFGSFAGIHILYKARSEKIQIAFSAFMFVVAVKMFMTAF